MSVVIMSPSSVSVQYSLTPSVILIILFFILLFTKSTNEFSYFQLSNNIKPCALLRITLALLLDFYFNFRLDSPSFFRVPLGTLS